MEQDWATAVAVATGELNAQEAFVTGRIRFIGDQQLLIDSQPVFAALDSVFATVRERTAVRLTGRRRRCRSCPRSRPTPSGWPPTTPAGC